MRISELNNKKLSDLNYNVLCKNKEISELEVKIEYSKKENNELKQQIKEFESMIDYIIIYIYNF